MPLAVLLYSYGESCSTRGQSGHNIYTHTRTESPVIERSRMFMHSSAGDREVKKLQREWFTGLFFCGFYYF